MLCSPSRHYVLESRLKRTWMQLLLFLTALFSLSTLANADFLYTENDGKITITGCTQIPEDGKLVIPAELDGLPVTAIGSEAFQDSYIRTVTLPETLEEIQDNAFAYCEYLKGIVLPDSLEILGEGAFDGCYHLFSVTLSESLQEIPDRAFSSCYNLKSVTIPGNIIRIGEEAFCECYDLMEVIFNEGLEEIDSYAFYDCDIQSVVLPSSVIRVADGAFGDCNELTSVTLNEGLVEIGSQAFASWEANLRSLTIPSTVAYMGETIVEKLKVMIFAGAPPEECGEQYVEKIYAKPGLGWEEYVDEGFYGIPVECGYVLYVNGSRKGFYAEGDEVRVRIPACEGFGGWSSDDIQLTADQKLAEKIEFTMPARNVYLVAACELAYTPEEDFEYKIKDGVAIITDCFSNQKDILVPPYMGEKKSRVASIDEEAFAGGNWHSVVLPKGVTEIRSNAFRECNSLTEVVLPSTLHFIDDYAFAWCAYLARIDIPATVEEIGDQAFYGCKSLTKVDIPAATTYVGDGAFAECDDLVAINVDAANKYHCSVDGVLFSKDMTTIFCYPNNKPGQTYTVPASVMTIGKYAINNANLQELILPEGLTTVESYGIFITEYDLVVPASVQFVGECSLNAHCLYFLGEPPELLEDYDSYISANPYNSIIYALPNKGWNYYPVENPRYAYVPGLGYWECHYEFSHIPVFIQYMEKPEIVRVDGLDETDFTGEIQVKINGVDSEYAALCYTVDGHNFEIYSTPITINKNTTVRAAYLEYRDNNLVSAVAIKRYQQPEAPQIIESIGQSGLEFQVYGSDETQWETQKLDGHGTVAYINMNDDYGDAIMETTVQGPGTVSFSWLWEYFDGEDDDSNKLVFTVDGNKVATYRQAGWQSVSYTITDKGPHSLAWKVLGDGGETEAWVADVVWESNESPTFTAQLLTGWNLLAPAAAIPETTDNQEVLKEFRPFKLNMSTTVFSQAALPLETAQVLWIYSDAPRSITFELEEKAPVTMVLPELKNGWNVIGIYGKEDVFLPDGYAAAVWTWEEGGWKPAALPLKPGKGYLIHK